MFGNTDQANPAAPASMIGRDGASASTTPMPAPATSISPTTTSPTDQPTSRYLEGNPTAPAIIGGGGNFIETGNGVPAKVKNDKKVPAAEPQAPDELIKIKQEALKNLAPLIDKLDQTPEERYKTLMMMIQASDNPQYLDEAYAAANGITDEKDKAQALLDIVNEINYFTQQSGNGAKA